MSGIDHHLKNERKRKSKKKQKIEKTLLIPISKPCISKNSGEKSLLAECRAACRARGKSVLRKKQGQGAGRNQPARLGAPKKFRNGLFPFGAEVEGEVVDVELNVIVDNLVL